MGVRKIRNDCIPLSTYRLQLNKDFTFTQVKQVIEYLSKLGISHCYISPYLKARPGSMHGYDIVDHNSLNPEIGSIKDFQDLCSEMQRHGLSQVMDIVPNHMAIGNDNVWWLDVLEYGPSSPYSNYFDIDWSPKWAPELCGKVLVPILESELKTVLNEGKIRLSYKNGHFFFLYYGTILPINTKSYSKILGLVMGKNDELNSILEELSETKDRKSTEQLRTRLDSLSRRSTDIASLLSSSLDAVDPDLLYEILDDQYYKLTFWKDADSMINYRRFFNINDLIGIRVEDPSVFSESHRFVMGLVRQGKVSGLRIDHPDGLLDPENYFIQLQKSCIENSSHKRPLYVVAEKILSGKETLQSWAINGTTGYDFANLLNGIFVDGKSKSKLEGIYSSFTGTRRRFQDIVYESKKYFIETSMKGESKSLAHYLLQLAKVDDAVNLSFEDLRKGITEIAACFPVYRTYINSTVSRRSDRQYIEEAVDKAKKRNQRTNSLHAISVFKKTILGKGPKNVEFAMKFQQFTAPVMAKGLEDTALYRYHLLCSLNEVGGDPQNIGMSVAKFHHANIERSTRCPHSMLATSTHDTKRSEDVRARINIISEMPDQWEKHVAKWKKHNRKFKTVNDDKEMPNANDEYLFYQTLLGAWPSSNQEITTFVERLIRYMEKATKESKMNTRWDNPNKAYDDALRLFVASVMKSTNDRFLKDFIYFQRRVSWYGFYNSISQTVLKLTCPGVPDTYQGTELWDYSLVDPDNRRPVDYPRRVALLGDLSLKLGSCKRSGLAFELLQSMASDCGLVKMYVIHALLQYRKKHAELFHSGTYVPLRVQGEKRDHIVSFLRRSKNEQCIVAVPRMLVSILSDRLKFPLGESVWNDTRILVKGGSYRNIFTDETAELQKGHIEAARIFRKFPVAVLTRSEE